MVKNYFRGLLDEGFVGYIKERKVLYGLIALMLFLRSDRILYSFSHHGFWSGLEDTMIYALLGVVLCLMYRVVRFVFHRWRYGKELEEWKAKEATPEYQAWFESLTPEEQMVELTKKQNIIAEQTMKTSKTTTAASVFTAGAAGATADAARKVVKVVKK